MLAESIRRNQDTPRPIAEHIILPKHHENALAALIVILNETPCIKLVRIGVYGPTLLRKNEHDWSTITKHNKRTAQIFYREKIATAFGLSGFDHWGKTKSKIREILFPRANQLLQLASVKRMLADGEHQGIKVVVASGFVFWFEHNDNVRWIVKEVSYTAADISGNTLWQNGTILSKNHGRIVLLPYIKANGEHVQGHTKNAPHDGKAIPRHPKEYQALPYEVFDDDLMIGLFGKLKYE